VQSLYYICRLKINYGRQHADIGYYRKLKILFSILEIWWNSHCAYRQSMVCCIHFISCVDRKSNIANISIGHYAAFLLFLFILFFYLAIPLLGLTLFHLKLIKKKPEEISTHRYLHFELYSKRVSFEHIYMQKKRKQVLVPLFSLFIVYDKYKNIS
jgi:hypothetical protein